MTNSSSNPPPSMSHPPKPISMTYTGDIKSTNTEFILDDSELLSILASVAGEIHAENHIQTPTMAISNWEDWSQDVPGFDNNKRKRNDNDLIDSDDDEDDELNYLDQFDFVDATFDHPPLTQPRKKQKIDTFNNNSTNFADENINDLFTLLNQSDSFMTELDWGWISDIVS